MKNILLLLLLSYISFAGDYYKSVIIEERKHCCECRCEYRKDEDVIFYGEDIRKRYKYFGSVAHICIGHHARDEKGVDLSKTHEPHVCYGEWCDKDCCFSVEDYFYTKYKQEDFNDITDGYRPHPVIPTPPPVSSMN